MSMSRKMKREISFLSTEASLQIDMMIKPENFDKAKAVKFIVGDIIISLLTWVAIAPALDIIIYKEPQGKVFIQGFAAALSNAFVVAVLGTILIFAFS